MSEETPSSPENTPAAETVSAPKARRISTPRPKKAAKVKAETPSPPTTDVVKEDVASKPAPEAAPEVESIPFPKTSQKEEQAETAPQGGKDWAEQEAESTDGAQAQSESTKRKRRRRKGKGQGNGPQNSNPESTPEDGADTSIEVKSAELTQDQRSRHPQQSQNRPKIDPEMLAKMAWKIYLAEVSEEGVALIGDNDARDLSRRCFRLAEIFIEEQARRR